jgi:hypothetical protein
LTRNRLAIHGLGHQIAKEIDIPGSSSTTSMRGRNLLKVSPLIAGIFFSHLVSAEISNLEFENSNLKFEIRSAFFSSTTFSAQWPRRRSRIIALVPCPWWLSRRIDPPLLSTHRAALARPTLVPASLEAAGAGSKARFSVVSSIPAVVTDADHHATRTIPAGEW